jgi:glutamate decarboxylase
LLTLQKLHYLGGTEESFTLNFSRPGAQVIAQYYNLIHLGFEGYRGIMENALANARLLSKALESSGWYRCVSDIHRPKGQLEYKKGEIYEGKEGETSADYNAGLPVVAFTLTDEFHEKYPHVKQVSISNLLRAKQYIIPSKCLSTLAYELCNTKANRKSPSTDYPLPPKEEGTKILRVVVRETMSMDLLDRLITDIFSVTEGVMNSDEMDLEAWQPFQEKTNAESTHGSLGAKPHETHKHKRPMSKGVHRTVC